MGRVRHRVRVRAILGSIEFFEICCFRVSLGSV